MAIVITEHTLDKDTRESYNKKGYEIYRTSAFDTIDLKPGEAIIFELSVLYKSTIDLIDRILYNNDLSYQFTLHTFDKDGNPITQIRKHRSDKHNLTLKYGDKVYKLNKMDEWKYTYQSDVDVNRVKTYRHPILQVFEDQRAEYFDKERQVQAIKDYNIAIETLDNVPNDLEIDTLLDTYGKYYGIYVPDSEPVLKLKMYQQLKYYLEHNIEPDYIPDETQELSVGDNQMLEDFIYKYREC